MLKLKKKIQTDKFWYCLAMFNAFLLFQMSKRVIPNTETHIILTTTPGIPFKVLTIEILVQDLTETQAKWSHTDQDMDSGMLEILLPTDHNALVDHQTFKTVQTCTQANMVDPSTSRQVVGH